VEGKIKNQISNCLPNWAMKIILTFTDEKEVIK